MNPALTDWQWTGEREYMPLLWSLVGRAVCVAINMALLTELCREFGVGTLCAQTFHARSPATVPGCVLRLEVSPGGPVRMGNPGSPTARR